MIGLVEHIAKQNREEVYLKTFEWVLTLPNFILSKEQKKALIFRLFGCDICVKTDIEISFNEDFGHLKIEPSESALYFLGIQQYRKDPDFYIDAIDKGANIRILYENDSPDNLKTSSVSVVSYTMLIRELSKLNIKDCKTQYFVDDFIEGIADYEKVEHF